MGGGGFILWDEMDRFQIAKYEYYGPENKTNNESEAQAMVDGLHYLVGA